LSPAALATCLDFGAHGQLPATTNQAAVTLLCNRAFATAFSGASRDPVWSAEHLTEEDVEAATAMPGRATFHADTRLPAGLRSELDDYKRSGWSRGHMVPSGDAPDRLSREETFGLSDIVPQDAEMNSGLWDQLERAVRDLAVRDGEIYVVTGPAFKGDRGSIGPDHVRVPSSIWKAIYDPSEHTSVVVVCKNMAHSGCAEVNFAALQRVSGVDPFPAIAEAEKNRTLRLPGWATGRGR